MNKQKGFSQIIIMVVMLVLAIALPITTNLVKKSQENRSKAATVTVNCSEYNASSCETHPECYWYAVNNASCGQLPDECRNSPLLKVGEACSATFSSANRMCKSGICKDGYCVESKNDCIHQAAGKVVKNGELLCWDWDIHTCTNGDLEIGVVNCNSAAALGGGTCKDNEGNDNKGACTYTRTPTPTPPREKVYCKLKDGECISSQMGSVENCMSRGGQVIGTSEDCSGTTPMCCVGAKTPTTAPASTAQAFWSIVNGECKPTKIYANATACAQDHAWVACYESESECKNHILIPAKKYWSIVGGICKETTKTYSDINACTRAGSGGKCYETESECKKNITTTAAPKAGAEGGACMNGWIGTCVNKNTSGVCSNGQLVTGSAPWPCPNGGSNIVCCSAKTGTDAACGSAGVHSANNRPVTSTKPTTNLCSSGTATVVSDFSSYWLWRCDSSNGGSNIFCFADKPTVTNGVCGSANKTNLVSAPTTATQLCSSGKASEVKLGPTSTYWYWECLSTNGGKSSGQCVAYKPAICTPNYQKCEDGTRYSTCTSSGQWSTSTTLCSSGKVCTVGKTGSSVCETAITTPAPITTNKMSFKISFSGLKPNALCESTFMKNLTVTLNKDASDQVVKTGVVATKVSGETNDRGEQVYLVSDLVFEGNHGSSANNLRIKGYDHSQMKYCTNGQAGRAGDICNLKLDGSTYDFSDYPILAGDIVSRSTGVADGKINVLDFTTVKKNLDPEAVPACGKEGDLNGDGVVNNFDLGLVKDALSRQEDQ